LVVGKASFASDQVMSATTMSHVQLIPTLDPADAAKSHVHVHRPL
jgi:hypothetical protein